MRRAPAVERRSPAPSGQGHHTLYLRVLPVLPVQETSASSVPSLGPACGPAAMVGGSTPCTAGDARGEGLLEGLHRQPVTTGVDRCQQVSTADGACGHVAPLAVSPHLDAHAASPACSPRGRPWRGRSALYLSTSFLWWQAVAGIRGGTSSHTQRNNSRCAWRHREGARNVHNTAIRRALSPLHHAGASLQTSTADPEQLHRSGTPPRAGTPQWPRTGGETTQSLQMPRDARPACRSSFRLLAMASPQLAARRKLLI